MEILSSIYRRLLYDMPCVPPESGGILGGDEKLVSVFEYDEGFASKDRLAYVPNVRYLNRLIQRWEKESISFMGIVHTHPEGQTDLSAADTVYIKNIFRSLPETIKTLFFPVIIPKSCILAFRAKRENGSVVIEPDEIIIKGERNNGKK